jgi:heme-degrading monooxygenase HmoA
MIVVIFEVEPIPSEVDRYFDLAAALKPELEKVDGFISVERFESLTTEGKYLSLSFWRDQAAVESWFSHVGHGQAQATGRAAIFKDYRIRVADVFRDYDMSAGRPSGCVEAKR